VVEHTPLHPKVQGSNPAAAPGSGRESGSKNGATTFGLPTFIIMTLSTRAQAPEGRILFIVVLRVLMLNVVMLNVIMLNVFMLNVIMLNVVIPNVGM
jgi:hypothetical protein